MFVHLIKEPQLNVKGKLLRKDLGDLLSVGASNVRIIRDVATPSYRSLRYPAAVQSDSRCRN